VSNPMGYSLRRSTGGRAWWSPSPPWPTLLCARRPACERASSAPLFADQNAGQWSVALNRTLSGRDAWLSGSAWPPWRGTLAQRTGAGPTGQQDLQLAEQLPQGQADATRFGERSRSRVTKPCATKTSVTWWCQPTQPRPSKRAAGLLGDRVDRHRKLAVGGLAAACPSTGAAPHRAAAVLGKAGVVGHPQGRLQRRGHHLSQPSAHRPPVPREDGDEVVQRLVVHLAEPGGHRLDRLAATVQQQPAQVALRQGAPISACKRGEDVVGQGLQASTNPGQLGGCEATHGLLPCPWTGDETSPHPLSVNRRPDGAS
jgi:hypothetical protein